MLLFVPQAGDGMGAYMTNEMEIFICCNTMQIIKIKQQIKYYKSGMYMASLKKYMTVIRDIIQNELKMPMSILTVYLIPENTHSSTEIFSNAN